MNTNSGVVQISGKERPLFTLFDVLHLNLSLLCPHLKHIELLLLMKKLLHWYNLVSLTRLCIILVVMPILIVMKENFLFVENCLLLIDIKEFRHNVIYSCTDNTMHPKDVKRISDNLNCLR